MAVNYLDYGFSHGTPPKRTGGAAPNLDAAVSQSLGQAHTGTTPLVMTFSANEQEQTILEKMNSALDGLASGKVSKTDALKAVTAAQQLIAQGGNQAQPVSRVISTIEQGLKSGPEKHIRVIGIPTMQHSGAVGNADDANVTRALQQLQQYDQAGADVRVMKVGGSPNAAIGGGVATQFGKPGHPGDVNFYSEQNAHIKSTLHSMTQGQSVQLGSIAHPQGKMVRQNVQQTAAKPQTSAPKGSSPQPEESESDKNLKALYCHQAILAQFEDEAQKAEAAAADADKANIQAEIAAQRAVLKSMQVVHLSGAGEKGSADSPVLDAGKVSAAQGQYQITIPGEAGTPGRTFNVTVDETGSLRQQVPSKGVDDATLETNIIQGIKDLATMRPGQEINVGNLPQNLQNDTFFQKIRNSCQGTNIKFAEEKPAVKLGAGNG